MKKNIKNFLKKLIYKELASNESYIKYLKNLGMQIGENCCFLTPNTRPIDEKRAKFIKMGNNCVITRGVIILAHDYSWSVLRKSHNDFLPTWGGNVNIGDNVFVGMNAIVLKDVDIGNNVIIGAGSVVTKSLPSNSVCGGNPCQVICTLDKFYEKRKNDILNQAYLLYKNILLVDKRKPIIEDFLYFGYLFTDKNSQERKKLSLKINMLADNNEQAIQNYLMLENVFSDFNDFELYCKKRIEEKVL